MNASELKQLIGGTVLIMALFIGLSSVSEWAQASGADSPWYRVDFYADHYTPPTPTPTPTPPPISVLITQAGGTLYSNDDAGSVMVQFAPGAVQTDSYMRYAYQSRMPVGKLGDVDRFFRLDAQRASNYQFYSPIFNSPLVTITVQYPSQNIIISGTEQLYWLDGTDWVTRGIKLIRRETNFLQVWTNHFSTFAVLGDTNHVYMPLVLK